jgi:hypothetical protein
MTVRCSKRRAPLKVGDCKHCLAFAPSDGAAANGASAPGHKANIAIAPSIFPAECSGFPKRNSRKGEGYDRKPYLADAELVSAVTGTTLREVLEEIGRSHDVANCTFWRAII